MKWLIMCCFRAKFATARVANKKYEYDFWDFVNAAIIVFSPVVGVVGPIIYLYDFPYELLIVKIIFISTIVSSIILSYILKRQGVFEKIMIEVDSLSEVELKKYRKKNSIVVICAGSIFIITILGVPFL